MFSLAPECFLKALFRAKKKEFLSAEGCNHDDPVRQRIKISNLVDRKGRMWLKSSCVSGGILLDISKENLKYIAN